MVAPTFRARFDNMTEGQSITLANMQAASGSGDTFNVYQGGTTVWTATSAAAMRGNKGAQITATAQSGWFDISLTGGTTIYGAMIGLTIPASPVNPTSNVSLLQFRNSGNTANLANVLFQTTGILSLVHGGGGTALNFNSNTALPTGQYWIWVALEAGTTTTNGKLYAKLIRDSDGTVIDNYSNTSANTTSGGTPDTLSAVRIGKPSSTGNWTGYLDEIMGVYDTAQIDVPALPGDIWTYKRFARFG